ncbi:facilitated trehalose transporter Tret1-like isoform X2 [Maniola jurtina]|nr:facilitated trehalose transporter Tret1-like isoform X2 [Maniola jurtina]XP_045768430.1 facilitated trehalose transporter Tret1-like isoform X2 [Maniola jurtina]
MEPSGELNKLPKNSVKSPRIYLLRQIFVCSGVTSYFFIGGLFFGAPTVFVPQIRKDANSTEIISMAMMSWLMSISNYGSLPWVIIFPVIAARFGRKIPYTVTWVNTMVCVSLFYFSSSTTELLISGCLQGIIFAVLFSISIMVLTEYTSPKHRGILITFKAATFYWGVWISNAIGTFFHWKNISILIFICCIYNITALFWPESPVWLASKGRFDECAKCHRWLKGEDKDSEDELKQLISSQQDNLKRKKEYHRDKQKSSINRMYHTIKSKRFYKPLMYSIVAMCLYHFSGKMACTGYVLHIIQTISVNESTAYAGMLVLDGITVLGMYVGVFLTKFLNRRTLLLGSSVIGITFLFMLSLYLYLIHLMVISENKYLTIFLIMGYSVSMSCGPMIMSMCFSTELTPLKGRSLFLSIFALLVNTIMGVNLQIFPFIFKYFKSHGAFLFYALMSSIFTFILYKVLPETKGKTIQEIEKCFSDEDIVPEEESALVNLDIRKANS